MNYSAYSQAYQNKVVLIYFYSSTCSSCYKINEFIDQIESKHNIKVKKYNITDLKNKSLLADYNKLYKTDKEDRGMVPVIFIKESFLIGEREIVQNLEKLIITNDGLLTKEIKDISDNHEDDMSKFLSFKVFSVLFAGLVNGINPCSMSMLLFFISLVMVRKINIMRIGLAFSLGKLLAYLLLGTVFFGLLSSLNIGWLHYILKILMLIVISILIIFNLNDYFAVRNEQYNKIKLQLPLFLRKLNHDIIKKTILESNLRFIVPVSFTLGVVISLGEFLCTGQIYLATIVTILQTSTTFNLHALIYLIIYDIAFVVPLLILTYMIYKGKVMFEITEVIRNNLHLIKVINVVIFIIFGIIVLILY